MPWTGREANSAGARSKDGRPGRTRKGGGASLAESYFALPEVVGVAMSVEAIADVVQRSVEEMAAGLGCSRLVAISCASPGGMLRAVTAAGFAPPNLREWQWTRQDFPAVESALHTRQIVVLPDANSFPAPITSYLSGECIAVPLVLGERELAVLVGQIQAGVTAHSPEWQAHAKEVAARAALVVELERVATAYQDELRLRQSAREVASAILNGNPLSEIADQILEIVGQRLREARVALFLGDSNGLTMPVALRNVSPEYGEGAVRLARRSSIVARAKASDLPYHAHDVQNDPAMSAELHALYRREGVTSILVAVLRHGELIKGALAVYPQSDRRFTPAELAVLQSFADQAALAVAITELLEQQRGIAVIRERNRLAREIHDTVAQSLASVVLQVEMTQTLLDADDRAGAREMLAAARALTKQALQETRRAVQGLAPAALERLTPVQAIEEETHRFAEQEGIPAQFVLTGQEQPLMPEQRIALLRIAQESLANARKHAQAQRVRVGLQYGVDEVILLVEDDGVGFDTTRRVAPGPEGGYGLFGMDERARTVRGDITIESTPGWGTRVRAVLPYRPASPLAVDSPDASPDPPGAATPSATHETLRPLRPAARADGAMRVLIVDDHAVTRQGLRAMLEASADIQVAGEAADGLQAVEQTRDLHPDLILMDLHMPRMDGLEGLRRLHAEQPDLPIVLLTTMPTDASLTEALGAGARGYLLKDMEPADILAAVRAAYRGETALAPDVTERLAALVSGQTVRANNGMDVPNERELEVLRLLAEGARNKEIAAQLFIAPKTVEYHLSNLFGKLGVSNRTEAVRVAMERGLVPPPSRS